MKSLIRTLLTSVLALAAIPAFSQLQATTPAHTFTIQGDHFALDGKPFKILSGELHYARIPREYWHARLKMARAMGLNTVATYVFWNIHEPTPGQFDFSGNNDLVAFIKAAQEEGLYVILRAGPYSCAEWEFGGFPAWLLKDPRMSTVLRSNDPAFMVPAERWIDRLGKEVADLQIGRGGPIIITQVENEYGGYKAAPDPTHAYMTHMRDIFLNAGFTDSLLDTVDGYKELAAGGIPGVFTGVNFGIDKHQIGMDTVASFQPGKPLFVSEYWPGWFDFWGEPHQTRPTQPQLDDVDYILHRGAGINLYMFHGGTDFGFMSGANFNDGNYFPETTSYDYGAPLDEAGHPTPKYYDFRKIFAKYVTCAAGTGEICLPPVPNPPPVITIPQVILAESTSLWDNLPTPIPSDTPKSMEQFDQAYGYILYRHQLPAAVSGDLILDELHDYAQIYIDGKLAGTLDRRNKQSTLPISTIGPARLDILVENSGRINFSQAMRGESKGITKSVTLAGVSLTGWQVFPLPMTTLPTNFTSTNTTSSPTFRRGHFTLTNTGDTFFDVRSLGKGALWINGHAIGRFWNIGPQQTLFVPGPWLREGNNEVIAFDLFPSNAGPAVAGLSTPILDAPIYPDTHFALHTGATLLLCLILLLLWHRIRARSNPQT
jgi:beta-galactosidase